MQAVPGGVLLVVRVRFLSGMRERASSGARVLSGALAAWACYIACPVVFTGHRRNGRTNGCGKGTMTITYGRRFISIQQAPYHKKFYMDIGKIEGAIWWKWRKEWTVPASAENAARIRALLTQHFGIETDGMVERASSG